MEKESGAMLESFSRDKFVCLPSRALRSESFVWWASTVWELSLKLGKEKNVSSFSFSLNAWNIKVLSRQSQQRDRTFTSLYQWQSRPNDGFSLCDSLFLPFEYLLWLPKRTRVSTWVRFTFKALLLDWFRVYDEKTNSHSFTHRVTKLEKGVIYYEGTVKILQNLMGWRGHKVLYFGDHPYSDLADVTLEHGWRTGAIINELSVRFC